VTPVQSNSETDIMPASYANTSYANILCQLMPTHLLARSQACRAKKLKMFASRGLVRISATCSAVGKYLRMTCFIDTTSWTKQTLRSMCFARRELPELHLMAAVLSSKITIGSLCWYLRSLSIPRSHITSWAQFKAATYSASAVKKATQPYFLLVQCTRSSPK
jgi:hypothetical protein